MTHLATHRHDTTFASRLFRPALHFIIFKDQLLYFFGSLLLFSRCLHFHMFCAVSFFFFLLDAGCILLPVCYTAAELRNSFIFSFSFFILLP